MPHTNLPHPAELQSHVDQMSSFVLDFSFYLIHGGKKCSSILKCLHTNLIKLNVKEKLPTFHFFFKLSLYFGNKKIHGFVLGVAVFSGLSIFSTIVAKYKDTIGLLLHPLFDDKTRHLFGTKAKLLSFYTSKSC